MIDLKQYVVKLQGRDYLPVAPRIAAFRAEHSDWTIETGFGVGPGDRPVAWARVMDDTGRVIATAHKTVTSFRGGDAEKAETGAIGRALSIAGYGTILAGDMDEGEELADAPVEQPATMPAVRQPKTPARRDGEFHASPLIEAMTALGDLPAVMRSIQTGYSDNPHARSAAWAKALTWAADNLCQAPADVDVVAAAFAKAKPKMTATDCGAAGLSIDTARVVLSEAVPA